MSVESDVVVVIDDDPTIRRALKALLSSYGYTVELYDSGSAFFRSAATCGAACLLVDVQLGSGSGIDLARELAEAGYGFPIIFMTANADRRVAQRALKAGGLGCLQKPFAADLLMDLLVASKAARCNDRPHGSE